MGIFKFSFGKKQEAANQDANTNSGAQQWQGMAEAVPFKNEVEAREKAQMERQQRKIIASVMYDRRYLSEPDVRLPQGAKEDFDVKIRAGEISDDMEKDFLMNIQTPVGALGAEQVNDRLGNNLHFRRMLGFAVLGEDGFKNYQQMMGPRAVESFARNYPTPMDFAKVSARMLDGIRRGSGEEKCQEYARDMEAFQKLIYGKRYEYYKSFEDLKEKATEDMTMFFDQEVQSVDSSLRVERYSDAEREKVMHEAVVDGDPFFLNGQSYQLSPQILDDLGLAPREKMAFDGAEIGLSGSFKVGSRDAIIGYVKTDEGYKVRGYYRSNSQGAWRYLPDYVTDNGVDDGIEWFGKGYTEEMMTLPAEMQKTLSEIVQEGPLHVRTAPGFVLAGTAKVYASKDKYREAVDNHALVGDVYQEVDMQPAVNFGVLSLNKNIPESVDVRGAYLPDFRHEKMEWKSESGLYGSLTNRVYESLNKGIKYTMSEDAQGRVFISSIETAGKITSTGLRKEWVSGGDLVTPLYEYASQDGGYGDPNDVRGKYRSMWKNYFIEDAANKRLFECKKKIKLEGTCGIMGVWMKGRYKKDAEKTRSRRLLSVRAYWGCRSWTRESL